MYQWITVTYSIWFNKLFTMEITSSIIKGHCSECSYLYAITKIKRCILLQNRFKQQYEEIS